MAKRMNDGVELIKTLAGSGRGGSRPKPPEAVAEGQPLQGSGQRRRSAAEVGGPRLRPSLA